MAQSVRSPALGPAPRVPAMSLSGTRSARHRRALSFAAASTLAAATLAISVPTSAAPEAPQAAQPATKGYAGAPVNPTPFVVTQPDGSAIQAYRFGDRLANAVATVKGDHTIVQGDDGFWRYAAGSTAAGKLRPSSVVVGQGRPPAASKRLLPAAQAVTTPNRAPVAGQGDDKELVILVQFADRAPVGSTPAQWADEYFGASGSVDDFYDEASGGKFGLTPATETSGTANDGVVGWISLPYDHPDTGVDDSATDDYVADAITKASDFVNFASYDTNADGELTTDELHITVIGAGYETSYSGPDNACGPSIWGHQWSLGDNGVDVPTVDGVEVGRSGYTTFGEFHCDTSEGNAGHKATMGIMAHEFGHDINWPDLYDPDYSSEGIGNWSLMSGGSWGTVTGGLPGASPSHPDAWSLWYQGWLTPTAVTTPTNGVAVEVGKPVLVSPNPGGVDWLFNETEGNGEYFLLENRQKTGFDASLKGCGIIAYKVNETVTPSNGANANDANPLVDVLEADGNDTYQQQASDPWPGTLNKTDLNGTTTPSTKFHDGVASGLSLKFAQGSCASSMAVDVVSPGAQSPAVTRPANDPFAAPKALTGTSGSVEQSTVHATTEPGEPKPAGSGRASVWFTWTAPAAGKVTFTANGSDYDTVLGVYTGNTLTSLVEKGSNDDETPGRVYTSKVADLSVLAGQTYRINAGGYGGDYGALKLAYSFVADPTPPLPPTPPTPPTNTAPVNDAFEAPAVLSGKKGSFAGTTVGATAQAGESVLKGKAAAHSVWFTWKAPKSGKVKFTAKGAFAPWLAIAKGSTLGGLKVLDSDTKGATGKVKVEVKKGKTYRILLDGGSGAYTLTWK